jgi:P-type Ca2+ transporter type 2C
MAAGTLAVLDASLPNGLIPGSGNLPHAQTMAFTTLMMFQLFNALNARSDEHSAFEGLFKNRWLWGAIGLAIMLQIAVVYVPVLQQAFSTVSRRLMRVAGNFPAILIKIFYVRVPCTGRFAQAHDACACVR